jgi:L-fuculose-phosphate aldolase
MIDVFKWIGKELFESGLVYSHGGDMSVKRGESIFITRRDSMLHHLADGDMIEVPLNGVSEKDKEASRELIVHRAIYKNTGASAIIHAHPPCAVAISISDNKVVPLDSEGSQLLKNIPIVRAGETVGSEDVARILPTLITKEGGAAMVKGHGSFAIGSTLEDAYKFTSALEHSCKILISLRSTSQSRPQPQHQQSREPQRRGAIPPGIGVMDRSRFRKRNIENR